MLTLSATFDSDLHAHWANEPQKTARRFAMFLAKFGRIDLRKPDLGHLFLLRAVHAQAVSIKYRRDRTDLSGRAAGGRGKNQTE